MPGHASSPYWTAVDFDSEGEEDHSPSSSRRVYLDPWDSEPYSFTRTEEGEGQGENLASLAGEPVSASFYYVPTKSYDSEEDGQRERGGAAPPAVMPEELASGYQRRRSRQHHHHESHADLHNYGYDVMPIQERRRSAYSTEDYYCHQGVLYEPLYHGLPPPLPPPLLPPHSVYAPPPAPGKRVSLPGPHPDYLASVQRNGKHRRPSRYAEACDRYAYESLMSECGSVGPAMGPEEWARRALPKAAPGNFHLSRYGHLKIDYSCSWSSLDRLIRNK